MTFLNSSFAVLSTMIFFTFSIANPVIAQEMWGASRACIVISVPAPRGGWKQGCNEWTGWAFSPEGLKAIRI